MQTSSIQIGPIELQDFEVPESLRFGGRHRLTVHALADGRRTVERLGPDDADIRFGGIFSGPTAESRARAFDNVRISGKVVRLSWASFSRLVIVRSFVANYRSPWWISYQASCLVVNQMRGASYASTSLSIGLSADLSSASYAAANSSISLAPLQAALAATNVETMGTSDQNQALAAVASTLAITSAEINRQSTLLLLPIQSIAPASELSRAYVFQVQSAGALAAAVNVRSYVGRIRVNLSGSY